MIILNIVIKEKIKSLEREFKGITKEVTTEAELLSAFLNNWPQVQIKLLEKLELSDLEIKKIMKVCDKYAEIKIKLVNERVPKNRKDVIILENDALERLYKPRVMIVKGLVKKEAFEVAQKWINDKYKTQVIMGPEKLDKWEDMMNETGRGIDFLIFDKEESIGYAIEVKD